MRTFIKWFSPYVRSTMGGNRQRIGGAAAGPPPFDGDAQLLWAPLIGQGMDSDFAISISITGSGAPTINEDDIALVFVEYSSGSGTLGISLDTSVKATGVVLVDIPPSGVTNGIRVYWCRLKAGATGILLTGANNLVGDANAAIWRGVNNVLNPPITQMSTYNNTPTSGATTQAVPARDFVLKDYHVAVLANDFSVTAPSVTGGAGGGTYFSVMNLNFLQRIWGCKPSNNNNNVTNLVYASPTSTSVNHAFYLCIKGTP